MKYHPILFTGDMVRAILDGRKTMTRRVTKPQPNGVRWNPIVVNGRAGWENEHGSRIKCPYGAPGDMLWVKESVWCYEKLPVGKNRQLKWPKFIDNEEGAKSWFDKSCAYMADYTYPNQPIEDDGGILNAMFMPRWASRINLEVKSVRVEKRGFGREINPWVWALEFARVK